MFDVMTLRFVVGLVSLTVLALFYLAVFRPTRSSFSGWWSLALLCASASSAFLLADGTPYQAVANPASTAASAAGAMCVYFAARSLRPKGNSVWLLVVATVVCVVGAAFDEPATNDWAGNGLLFGVMAAAFTAGAVEVWGTWSLRRNSPDARDSGEAITALVVSALAATLLASMYLLRLILYVTLGHEHPTFTQLVGSPTAALTLLICLVAVTFSVSGIGWDQRTRELRYQVARDDLTGLLGRSAFVARADQAIAASGGRRESQTWLVIADVDNFKPVNDEFGHQAGDRTLQAFADAARGALRTADTIGRLGGDEFGFVLETMTEESARARIDDVRERLATLEIGLGEAHPTASFGVAQCHPDSKLSEVMDRADAALYEAKRKGRDRVVVYGS